MSEPLLPTDPSRRTALLTTCTAGAVGGATVVWPFLKSLRPSERALAAGAPVEVDIGGMAPGELKRVEWRGKPVWVVRRTPEMLASLKAVEAKLADPGSNRTAYPTPDYAKNPNRAIKDEYLVVVGICTTWAARPPTSSSPAPSLRCPTTGPAASCAPATDRCSTWPAACSATCRPPTTSRCRLTSTCRKARS
jgi:ubiquinol-cytochrome c reductase iron-sulfur subunit